MKKTVIISFLLLLLLPFIFIKTVFPFYRFGMFAEPVKAAAQTEKFQVRYRQQQKWIPFKGTEFGLSKSVFAAMMRKAHYQNQVEEFLQKTASVVKVKATTWELWRFEHQDSTKVGQWQP